MKPLSEVAPGLLVIQIQMQAVCASPSQCGTQVNQLCQPKEGENIRIQEVQLCA